MKDKTKFKIIQQGAVKMTQSQGYMVVGNYDCLCFYIFSWDRAYVAASTYSYNDCPVLYLMDDGDDKGDYTVIEFTELKGWRFHAGGAGKSIAISLVDRGADYE